MRICLLLLSLTITDVVNLESTSQHHSAVNIKNGDDETVKSASDKASPSTESAAKFMINAYKIRANEPNENVEPTEFDLTENDLRTINQSDVIITFMAQQSQHGAGGNYDGLERLWFDVKAAPAKDQLISAQLRLYRKPNSKDLKDRGDFSITAYRVLLAKDGETGMLLVDSVNTTIGQQGWITLDVTESLLYWMKHPAHNDGLYLSVRSIDRSSEETKPEDIGMIGFEPVDERQPFMTGFFRNNENNDKARSTPPKFSSFEDSNKSNKKRDITNQNSENSCKVEKLYLSFTNPSFDSKIIAPEGYHANYCSGECGFMTFSEKVTNHSKFMSYGNLLHPERVPEPCCAPMKLSSINIIRYVDDNTIKNEIWDNMSVASCGCY